MFATQGVKAELLGGERATRTRVLERLAFADALHFAGHAGGRRAASPGRSVRATRSRRATSAHSRLRLVFANACSPLQDGVSGQAAASERLGLGRAFLSRGGRGLPRILFELEDGPACAFATALWASSSGAKHGRGSPPRASPGRALDSIDWAGSRYSAIRSRDPSPGPERRVTTMATGDVSRSEIRRGTRS